MKLKINGVEISDLTVEEAARLINLTSSKKDDEFRVKRKYTKRRTRRPYTQEEKDFIESRFEDGISVNNIRALVKDRYQRSSSSVHNLVNRVIRQLKERNKKQ